jgi:hypothetical protein
MSGTIVRPRRRGEPGLKGRHQLEHERVEQDEMLREIPLAPETVIKVLSRFCAADPDASGKVSYTDVITKVLQDAHVNGMGERDQELLLKVMDQDADGKVTPLETVAAQYFLTTVNQGFEAPEKRHERITYHGDVSKMKICVDEMFETLQLRSVSFLRMCLERSGKPVVVRDCDFAKIKADPAATAPEPGTDDQVGKHAHFGDAGDATMLVPNASMPAATKRTEKSPLLHSWLEDATTEASKQKTRKLSEFSARGGAATLHGGELKQAPLTQRDAAKKKTRNLDAFSKASSITRTAREGTVEPMEILQGLVVASSPRRRAKSPCAVSPTSERLLATLRTTEPAPGSNAGLMTSTHYTRGTALPLWGGNWGLRDANLTIQHEAYRILASPSGGAGKLGKTAREKNLLYPLPEVKHRGDKAVEQELRKIFHAYARRSDLFPSSNNALKDSEYVPFFLFSQNLTCLNQ